MGCPEIQFVAVLRHGATNVLACVSVCSLWQWTRKHTHTHRVPHLILSFCWYETHLVFVEFISRYSNVRRPGGFVVLRWLIVRYSDLFFVCVCRVLHCTLLPAA